MLQRTNEISITRGKALRKAGALEFGGFSVGGFGLGGGGVGIDGGGSRSRDAANQSATVHK